MVVELASGGQPEPDQLSRLAEILLEGIELEDAPDRRLVISSMSQLGFAAIDGDGDTALDDTLITYQVGGVTSTIAVLNTTEAELMAAGTINF